MPIVRTFDMKRVRKLIKESDKELQQYIKCLIEVSDGWERLTKDAVAKLRKSYNVSAIALIVEKLEAVRLCVDSTLCKDCERTLDEIVAQLRANQKKIGVLK